MILTKEKSAILGTKNGTGEGVACLKRWYVAHVRIHHEKKVAEYLGKMGIETFVPVQQEIHQWSDRRTSGFLPDFSHAFLICSSTSIRLSFNIMPPECH